MQTLWCVCVWSNVTSQASSVSRTMPSLFDAELGYTNGRICGYSDDQKLKRFVFSTSVIDVD